MVPTDSILFEHIPEIKDFSKQHNQQLQDFFINYMKAENKKLTTTRYMNASNAAKTLQKLLK